MLHFISSVQLATVSENFKTVFQSEACYGLLILKF